MNSNKAKTVQKVTTFFLLSCLLTISVTIFKCATLQSLADIQKPTLDVDDLRFVDISFKKLDLELLVQVNNPNKLALDLAGYQYELKLGQSSFLNGQQNIPLNIAAQSKSRVDIPISIDFEQLYNTFQQLSKKDSTEYEIQCGLDFDLPILGRTTVPIKKSGHLPLIKIPKISLHALQLKKLSFTGADLELQVKVNNPNAFSLFLNNLEYALKVNGAAWAKGNSVKQTKIGEKGQGILSVPVSLDLGQLGQTVLGLLQGNQNFQYEVQGNLGLKTSLTQMGQKAVPLLMDGTTRILK
jgi:LEA14-like dessication related protein